MNKILIYFLITLSHFLHAQNIWTIDQCIDYAFKNNLNIINQNYSIENSKYDLKSAKGNQLPTINGSMNVNNNIGRVIDPFTNQYTENAIQSFNFGLQASWVLFNGFQVQNTKIQNELLIKSTETNVEIQKINLAQNISLAYYNIALTQQNIAILKNQLNRNNLLLERTEKLYTNGLVTPQDIKLQQIQIQNIQTNILIQQKNLANNYQDLIGLMNYNESDSLKINSQLISEMNLKPIDDYTNAALENELNIKSLNYQQQASISSSAITKGKYYPRLTFNAGINSLYSSTARTVENRFINGFNTIGFIQNTGDSVITPNFDYIYATKPFFTQLNDNFNRFLGLSLFIPIFNGNQIKYTYQKSLIKQSQIENNIEQIKLDTKIKVKKAYQEVYFANQIYIQNNKTEALNKELYLQTLKKYQDGILNYYDVIQAENSYNNSQIETQKSYYQYLFQLVYLDLITNPQNTLK